MTVVNKIKQLMNNLAVFLTDSFFPIECLGCGFAGAWLCSDCRLKIPYQETQTCHVCRRASDNGITCQSCHSYLDGVMILAKYQSLIKRAIVACKYNFAYEIGHELSQLMLDLLIRQNWHETDVLILPMPLSINRLNWRGFNQSEIIARNLANKTKYEFNTADFVKYRETEVQAKLGWQERSLAQEDCFEWRGEELNNKNIIIVDDVMTTGATLQSASRALKLRGANKVWAIVLARGV